MPKGFLSPVLTSAVVRAEFIKALIALRSVKLAIERCGIAEDSLYLARRRFPEFAAAWLAARSGVAVRRPRAHNRLSKTVKASFLVAIASGVSVTAAAARVDHRACVFYEIRRRDPDFAAGWHQARADAMEEMESVLIERVIHGVERTMIVSGVARVVRHFDMAAGLKLLARRSAAGPDRPAGRVIELTPEVVAIARRKVVELLVEQGSAAFEP